MDLASKKLNLVQRLLLILDEAALQRVAKVIEQEAPELADPDEITDEELTELEIQRAERLSGKVKFLTAEESIRQLREAQKR